MNTWYAISKKESDEAEISIYDAIGAWGVTAQQFVGDLKKINAKTIHVRINTPGGEVFDGTAIYNALREHPARIIIHIDGVAASAGSFIAMSGDEVRMADNAYLMIHDARGGVMGEAEDMRKYAEVLDKINDNISGIYAEKTGKDKPYWRNLMAEETWFTASEAEKEGLIDAIEASAKKDAKVNAAFDFKIYNKIPDPVQELWGLKNRAEQIGEHVPPPVDSQRSESQPGISKENTAMADTSTTAAPATTPSAVATDSKQGGHDYRIREMNAQAIAGHRKQAKEEGFSEGVAKERERMKAISDACPGNPAMALEAFLSGHDAASVKLAYDAAKKAEDAIARRAAQEKLDAEAEIARLNALIATGGHSGVSIGLGASEGDDLSHMEPKSRAEWEWENMPQVRKTARTKELYVLARAAELDGTHRSFSAKS